MPRSGWVALGAVIGALGTGALGDGRSAMAGLLAASAVALGSGLLGLSLRTHRPGGEALAKSVALAAIGVALIAVRLVVAPLPAPALPAGPLPGGDGPWSGTVLSVGAPKAGAQAAVVQLAPPHAFTVAATLPVFPVVVPGDRVAISGPLRPPPDDDPYADYLLRIGAAATLRAASVQVLPASGDVGRTLEGLRRTADAALRTSLPEPEAGLASGILVGLRDRVDRDLTAAFTAVGATHVVAISGWNIAIVATSLAAIAGRVARRRRMALTAVAIVAYVVFVGPSPSVLRAAAMAGVVMAARELGRPSRAAAAIGWAATGLLVVSPPMVEDAGFRLSALATVGLISWGTPLAERLAGPAPGRVRSWLAESLGVSLAAQLATLPVVVLSFGRLSIVSPVVNLGVVPLVAPAMGAGAIALAGGLLSLAGLPAAIATILGLPAWMLFAVIVGLVRTGASLPFASLQLAAPWDALVATVAGAGIVGTAHWLRRSAGRRRPAAQGPGAAATTGVAVVSPLPAGASPPARSAATARPAATTRPAATASAPGVRRARRPIGPWWRSRSGRVLIGGLVVAVAAVAVVVIHRPDGVPRVTVLDVGQGDAILVEGERGGRLLVDGGPDPGRLLIALDEHLPPWDRRIDLVILSHPHEDHAAGLAAVLDRYGVRRVLEPGMVGPGPGYAALNAELVARDIDRGTLATGDRLAVDGIRFQVLWPDPGSVPERPPDGGTGINNVSIVLLGVVDGHRFLLAGDIEQQIDPILVRRGLPHLDFLKVAHHGSRTASTEPFLAMTRPGVAVVSAGRGNPYGHPAPATLDRLRASGARVFRTDEDGSVTVDLGPGPVRARASGGRPSSATPPAQRVAFLCGLPPRPSVFDGPGGSATAAGAERPAARGAGAATSAAPGAGAGTDPGAGGAPFRWAVATGRLGYDPVRDVDAGQRIASAAIGGRGAGAGRLLLGRRRLRPRGGHRGLPTGHRPVPRRPTGALADPGRGRRQRPPPQGARGAAGHGHDVRRGDTGDPGRGRPAGAEGLGSGRDRGHPRDHR